MISSHCYAIRRLPRGLVKLPHELACCTRTLATQAQEPAGLLSTSGLKSAADFTRLSSRAIERCRQIRDEIVDVREKDTHATLLLLDRISNEVCSVIDVAEFCRSAHEDTNYRQSAEECFGALSSYIHGLNADLVLYNALRDISENSDVFSKLPEEYQLFTKDMKLEFESDGIHLEESLRKRAMQVQGEIVAAETLFTRNVAAADSTNNFVLGPFNSSVEHKRFKDWLAQFVSQPYSLPNLHVLCSGDRRVASAVLKSVDEEPLRKTVWTHIMTQPASNISALGNLIKKRQELAAVLEHESFAHKFLSNKIARTPQGVGKFLAEVAESVKPRAQKELEALTELKDRLQHNNQPASSTRTQLQPWDLSYLQNVSTSIESESSPSGQLRGQQALSQISAYFPLSACLEGLAGITSSLFGITARFTDLSPSESWVKPVEAFAGNGAGKLLQSGLVTGAFKCEVTGAGGEKIGTVYLDLFRRSHKFPGAAHFTLRCGCSNGLESNSDIQGSNEAGKYQLPIVALSFNFNPPTKQEPLLTLYDIETLHHEWGHALHSLLSRTTFQHLSGTRGGVDFVEVPSHLFEHFSRTPSVICQWARHYMTGQQLPRELVEEALRAKGAFEGIDTQTQIIYSAADQVRTSLIGAN
jgi:mitochondrial intermediate peptidase